MDTKNGYVVTGLGDRFLHRLIYYKAFPSHPREYDVHHIDGTKHNNSIENLIAIPRGLHSLIHRDMAAGAIYTKKDIEKLYSEYLGFDKAKIRKQFNVGRKNTRNKVVAPDDILNRRLMARRFVMSYQGKSSFISAVKAKIALGGEASITQVDISVLESYYGARINNPETKTILRKKLLPTLDA